ncbi:MAG TPA: HD domain-containing phosphohydrolase [Polyangia bacterium]|nr:HD domain-containing phosphohydrolase [Polyangia bacterium]
MSASGDANAADHSGYVLAQMVATSRSLASERDIDKLLAAILQSCREVTGADAGSVYVIEDEDESGASVPKRLRFRLSQNDSIKIDFKAFTLPVDDKSIVGQAALSGQPINVADLARKPEAGRTRTYTHNRSFDDQTGYRARSMLTVPMQSAMGEVIGVIQLINKKREPSRPLAPGDFDREVVPFDQRAEELASAWAAQAGIALENALLYKEIRGLFDGFVEASVKAIESRDPTTSGHSRRVATLSVDLAKKIDGLSEGAFAAERFDETRLQQIEYAAVLHDFGKVGVRERVLVKAKKLYEEDRRAIGLRFAYVKKALEVEHAERKLRVALELSKDDLPARIAEIDAELGRRMDEVDEAWGFVNRANEPTVLEQGGFERLVEIAQLVYLAADGELRPYLERDEVAALQVRRGSLTDVERVEIEHHVVHTYNFLRTIPWGKRYADVPRIAAAHHEYLNGSGYPHHLGSGDIPLESRIMTIADIFDALTAADRPYKKAVPIDKALGIIEAEVKAGKCDAALFRVFVEGEVYKKVL